MNIYTKNGDRGTTDLVQSKNVSKSDDRIALVGTVDELTSHLGLVKTMISDPETIRFLEKIQGTLATLMAGVADPYNHAYKLHEEKTELLEEEIDRLAGLFDCPKKFILPGSCRISAEIDVARTVARRAERALALVSVRYGADNAAKKYMNRLADYLYMLARYEDARSQGQTASGMQKEISAADPQRSEAMKDGIVSEFGNGYTEGQTEKDPAASISEAVIREVLQRMGIQGRIMLDSASRLIQKIEGEAKKRNMKAVIAVCSPEGNPVAVHVMDGAFLAGFEEAMKKAYTAVAVRRSTMELSQLAGTGKAFFGAAAADSGKLVFSGGGVPLKMGDVVIGGLGISGGNAGEDHSLCEYGLSILPAVV